jgi:DNA-binding NarL/FixJ family response regulator
VIRLCAADDHQVVIDGIAAMAARTDDIEFCGAVGQLADVPLLVERAQPDVLLLDLRFGEQDSLEACAELGAKARDLRVLVFSGYGDVEILRAAVRAGASGYVLKDTSTRDLPHAIRTCATRGSYFDPQLIDPALILGETAETPARAELSLTSREETVLRLVANGLTNAQIAASLHYSVHTVKLDIARILRRVGVRRRVDLARYAATSGLLEDDRGASR